MLKSTALGLISGVLIAGSAYAHPQQTVTYAQVIDARPVYRSVERVAPRQRCWVETSRVHQAPPSATGAAVTGGVAGGVIGHALGRGRSNKQMGAVVGAALGAAVGNDIARQSRASPSVRYREVERCDYVETLETSRELIGYDVIYRFHGQNYSTHTRHHPGDKLPVRIQVSPILN